MPQDSLPAAVPAPDISLSPPPPPPGLLELFIAFAKMSLAGFGGVLVWARRGIVDQHRWMTAEEFNETFALCHFLPGPNIVNLSMVFGARFRGIAGGIAAFAGLLLPPMALMTILGALYARYGEIDVLRRILAGVSCAANSRCITRGRVFCGFMPRRWMAKQWALPAWRSFCMTKPRHVKKPPKPSKANASRL